MIATATPAHRRGATSACRSALTMPGRRAVATAVLLACKAAQALALDRNWVGSTGHWGEAGNWSPVGVPGADDRALIATGNAVLSFAELVGGLVMTGGTISGSGSLTISGGRMVQTLGATSWGGNTAPASGNVRFDTGGGSIVNHGDWTDSHAFNVTLGSGPAITDKRFQNFGSDTKTGAGVTESQVGFDNQGAVIVEAGRLALRGAADSNSTGSFHIAADATLSFGIGRGSVGLATLDGASFTSSGRRLVDANDSGPVAARHGSWVAVHRRQHHRGRREAPYRRPHRPDARQHQLGRGHGELRHPHPVQHRGDDRQPRPLGRQQRLRQLDGQRRVRHCQALRQPRQLHQDWHRHGRPGCGLRQQRERGGRGRPTVSGRRCRQPQQRPLPHRRGRDLELRARRR